MIRQSPKYTVTTLALVIITVAAFGLKFASQYLPERRPNDLAGAYGEYLRRSMRQNVQWFPLSDTPLQQAETSDKTVFLEIGSTMSFAAKQFSEDYATDGEYRQLFHDHFETVKVDALEMPWVVDALSLNAGPIVITDRFRAIAMDSKGALYAATVLLPKDGDDSLSSWLTEIARKRYSNRAELEAAGTKSIAERLRKAPEQLQPGQAGIEDVAAWSSSWETAGISGELALGTLPVSTLPMETLLSSQNSDSWGAGLALMLALAFSPSSDVIDGGFFVTSYEPRWRGPVTAKLAGQNLLLAAAFAETGRRFELPLFESIARRAADWALGLRRGGLFLSGVGTDQQSDRWSPYYSFEVSELQGSMFAVDQDGVPFVRDVSSFAQSVSADATRELSSKADELSKRRKAKTLPRLDPTTYADLNGQAVSGLLRIGIALDDPEYIRLGVESFRAVTDEFVMPLGDILHAPSAARGRTGYCADYAWFTRAAIDAFRATGTRDFLAEATTTADRALELFQGESGALMVYLPSLLSLIGYDFPVYICSDTDVLSANALWAINLADLAAITGERKYQIQGEQILRAFSGKFRDTPAPAGFILAGRRLFGDYVLYHEVESPAVEDAISFPAPPGRIGNGAFRVRESKVIGKI